MHIKDYSILVDLSSNKRVVPWQDKHKKSLEIAASYERINESAKAARMRECGTLLEFKVFDDNAMQLHRANFCKIRLCPMCAWRRSLKIFGQVSQIMDEAQKDSSHEFIFLTLTIKNVLGNKLSAALDALLEGYNKLLDKLYRKKKYKKYILGAFRVLEITHNLDSNSEFFNTFHPHLHCILMVNKGYFSNCYISQDEWRQIWQDCINSDYLPLVNVQKIENINGAVREVAKYTLKDSDLLYPYDNDLQDSTVRVLDDALFNRRLVSFSGEFYRIRKRLKLDDCIDGDLVQTDINNLRDDIAYAIVRYRWHAGYNNYVRLNDDNDYVL